MGGREREGGRERGREGDIGVEGTNIFVFLYLLLFLDLLFLLFFQLTDVVYYDDIVSNIFGGNVEAFTGLLNANLLRVTGNRVTAYSPLYRYILYPLSLSLSPSLSSPLVCLSSRSIPSVPNLILAKDRLSSTWWRIKQLVCQWVCSSFLNIL